MPKIVGASFGALSAATALPWPQFQVTQAQYDLFVPLLYQVAAGARQAYFDHHELAAHGEVPARDASHHRHHRHHGITQGGHGESEQAAGATGNARRRFTLARMSVND